MTKRLTIAGTNSGVGKTTITMGLIAALRNRGLRVQPFKAGPDYIDPTYHSLAAGRPCRNIDTWMVPPDRAVGLFDRAASDADIAVVEGVMGVFDGSSYTEETGSTAEIAKLVDAPVLLILDVGKMARSAGALARGYTQFDPDLNIAGFILNRCGSERHYNGVKQAVEQATARPVVGWLPKDADLHIPERHLGLVPTNERGELTTFITHAADLIEQYFDMDAILDRAERSDPLRTQSTIHNSLFIIHNSQLPVIAVARDDAFSFYYEDNLDMLREAEAKITFFSPLTDSHIPPETQGIYIGGGFPEVYAAQLARNHAMQESLRQAHSDGMPIYAECGGFMLLTEAIIDMDGVQHPMVGLVPGTTHMQPKLAGLGYRLVEAPKDNFLLPPGTITRGHEFRWSEWVVDEAVDINPAWVIQPRRGRESAKPSGYSASNLIASYVHLHFGHDPQIAANFVGLCANEMESKAEGR